MNPSITAVISKEWKQRMLLMTLIVAGAGCWFLYDGLVGYPNNNVRAAVYLPLRDKLGKDTPELEKAWAEETKARGWSDSAPKKIYDTSAIRTQIFIAIAALIGAGLCARHFFASLKTTTRFEDGKILLPDGRVILLSKVRAVSRKRWKNKGIADLVYEEKPGRMKRFILDDYKYIGAEQILLEVEKVLPQEGVPVSAPKPDETAPGNY